MEKYIVERIILDVISLRNMDINKEILYYVLKDNKLKHIKLKHIPMKLLY